MALSCPRCSKRVPEVLGAPEQECPHCGLVFQPGAGPAPDARERAGVPPTQHAGDDGLDPAGAVAAGVKLYARHARTFLAFWAPVLALDLVLTFASLAWRARNDLLDLGRLGDAGASADLTPALRFLGFVLPLYLATWVVKLAWWGAHAPLVHAALSGARPKPRSGWALLKERWRPLVATGATLAIVLAATVFVALVPLLLLGSIGAGAGPTLTLVLVTMSVLMSVPFFTFLHWYVYAPAAASAPGATVTGALAASRAFAKEKKTAGFTLVVLLVMSGAFLAANAVSTLGYSAADATAPAWRFVLEETLAAGAAWVLAPIAPTIVAAYWFGATRASGHADRGTAPRAAPAPAVVAAGGGSAAAAAEPAPMEPVPPALKTTKCPGCATVFPYAPNEGGDPVRVRCPTCGKAGLVR